LSSTNRAPPDTFAGFKDRERNNGKKRIDMVGRGAKGREKREGWRGGWDRKGEWEQGEDGKE